MKMGNKVSMIETTLVCPKCENVTSIYRREASQRVFGHKKRLYCWKCKKKINHIELKDYNLKLVVNN